MRLKYKLEELYYSIRNYFFPRQKWLLSKIPNHYSDPYDLIEITLLEILRYLVEDEKYFEHSCSLDDPDIPEHQKNFMIGLKENYKLMTEDLPRLNQEIEKEWDVIGEKNPMPDNLDDFIGNINKEIDYQFLYGRMNKLEEELNALKTKILSWIISNRQGFWN